MDNHKKYQIRQSLPIFAVLFLGYLGYSLVLPIFAPMLLNPKMGLLPADLDINIKSIILGILIAMYPLGQFFGCPLLGKLSDIYGRRKLLLISLAVIVPGYLLSGYAVTSQHIALLIISRLIIGLCEGNIVIATAAITDISDSHTNKIKNFGWITTVSSSGFIIGPLIGGKLADADFVPWFTYATPFYIASIVVAIGWLMVYVLFIETKTPQVHLPFKPLRELKGLYRAIHYKQLRGAFVGNFFLYLAFFFFFSFLPPLLVKEFEFTASLLAEVESYLALCICITPLFYKKFSKYFTPRQIAAIAGAVFSLSSVLLFSLDNPRSLVFTLLLPGFCVATGFTYATIIVSDRIASDKQGEALGTNQAILVFCEFMSGLLGGLLASLYMKLPLIAGSISAMLCAAWLMLFVNDEIVSDQDR